MISQNIGQEFLKLSAIRVKIAQKGKSLRKGPDVGQANDWLLKLISRHGTRIVVSAPYIRWKVPTYLAFGIHTNLCQAFLCWKLMLPDITKGELNKYLV